METAETIPPVEARLRKHRSALTNGNRLFVLEGNADGRSATYRRFNGAAPALQARGDAFDYGCMECDAVGNKPFDVDLYGQLTDRLGRCLQRLGLERKARDVTPTLQSYLAAKAQP